MIRVGCIASADPRVDAVGRLELECSRAGLVLVYRGVSTYRAGYAPGPPVDGAQRCVPWPAVHVHRLPDERLLLELDATLGPHTRLLLGSFVAAEPRTLRERFGLGPAALVLGVVALAIACWSFLPVRPTPRALALTAIGLGLGSLLVALVRARRKGQVVPSSAFARFVDELNEHTPCLPDVAAAPVLDPGELRAWSLDRLGRALPRSVVAIAITLTASGLATLLTAAWLARGGTNAAGWAGRGTAAPSALPALGSASSNATAPDAQAPRSNQQGANATEPARAQTPTPLPSPSPVTAPACACARDDSALWRAGVPRLSLLVVSRRERWHGAHRHLDLELAAVNNGDRALEELTLDVVFYEESAAGSDELVESSRRPLFHPGPIRPGESLRWRLEGRGSRFELHAPALGPLSADGSDAAPADAFLRLLGSNHRSVRLHAAMILAFLGHERARSSALELRATMREPEALYLEQLLLASSALRVCNVEVTSPGATREGSVRACVHNVGEQALDPVGLRIRVLEGEHDPTDPLAIPPLVLAERRYQLPFAVPPQRGYRVDLPHPGQGSDEVRSAVVEVIEDRSSTAP